ncbi:hypothetical protein E2C01_087382 [Portunus trituberculatus]|uniref:Uncharacterized protein n=1 Tax=Portunus trituberculatus TaxID=210409 RepID=A0A5B7J7Y8_PORTR|nr:hypothetical protein [Portunus trituberculatus]
MTTTTSTTTRPITTSTIPATTFTTIPTTTTALTVTTTKILTTTDTGTSSPNPNCGLEDQRHKYHWSSPKFPCRNYPNNFTCIIRGGSVSYKNASSSY